jgi:putative transposase
MASSSRHKNIRLAVRNYRGVGWYFLTLCAHGRKPYFRVDATARWLVDELHAESARQSFQIEAFCLMPNHLHVLAHGVSPDADLLRFVKALKHKTSFEFLKRTHQQLWQTSFYDHILRNCEAEQDVARYIWLNPVRARLVDHAAEYPYSGPRESEWFRAHAGG